MRIFSILDNVWYKLCVFHLFLCILWLLLYKFFISANTICLYCSIKINKLLHNLIYMICFIIKSSSQLNFLLISIFFCSTKLLIIYIVVIAFIFSFSSALCRLYITIMAVKFVSDRFIFQSNYYYHKQSSLSSCKVVLLLLLLCCNILLLYLCVIYLSLL